MNTYVIENRECTSIELKELLVSRGLNVDKEVYKRFKPIARLSESPLCTERDVWRWAHGIELDR